MKKFKNIKLMLLGLLCLGSMNAFALDGDYKTDGKGWYWVANEAKGEVHFCGISVVVAAPTEVKIAETVSLPDDDGTSKKTYKVVSASSSWWTGGDAPAGKARDLSSTAITKLEFEFRSDWDAPMTIDGSGVLKVYDAVGAFASSLKTVVIKNAHKVYALPVLNTLTNLETLDLSGVSDDGAGVEIPAAFLQNLAYLKTVKLPENEPLAIKANAFDGIHGTDASGKPTEVTGIDIEKATEIGNEAFRNAYVKKVTIGENVSSIDLWAFVAPVSSTAYLEEVTWKSNKVMGGDPVAPLVAAAFPGQVNIKKVVVEADKVKSIQANAFTAATPADPFELDLSKASALATVAGALPDVAYKTLKLQGTNLAGDDLNTLLGFTLADNSQGTLETLTLPDGLTAMTAGEFNSYTKLKEIGLNMATIPDNAFNGCTTLATLTLGDNVKKIGNYAFYGTNIKSIKIPGGVETIGDFAFANNGAKEASGIWSAIALDLSGAANLKSIGTNVFEDANITGTVDFSATKVTAIPANAFNKTWTYGPKEANFLTAVILKEGSASSKVSIGTFAFAGNPKLAKVDNLNQANYDFDADPAKGKPGIDKFAFSGTALTAVELDQTPITVIEIGAFEGIKALKTVKLNANTTKVSVNAFGGDTSLGTVNWTDLTKLATIGAFAFNEAAFTELDLSKCTSLRAIDQYAFGQNIENAFVSGKEKNNTKLTKIVFPADAEGTDPESTDKNWNDKYNNKIALIGEGAFFGANKVTTIENTKDLKITTLNQWFTNNIDNNIDLATSDPAFNTMTDDQIRFCPVGVTSFELPNVSIVKDEEKDDITATTFYWKAKDVTTGSALTMIDDYALQGLGISEIAIPATVTAIGGCVLQGCLSLTDFYMFDAAPDYPDATSGYTWITGPGLHKYTFRGNSNLENCYFMTSDQIAKYGLTDNHFFWCSKEKLQVYVTKESLLQLRADGYTTANAKYSKLNDELNEIYTFNDNGFNEQDKYYYATYWDMNYATWFDPAEVEVFTAYVKGNQIEMVPADQENGYYKVGSYGSYGDAGGVCIIRSKNKEVKKELFAIPTNDISTLDDGKNDLTLTTTEIPVSKLTFQFKLGKNKNTGAVGFFRIKTGTFKANTVYIQASSPARFADFIEINGDATGIQNIEAAEAEDGAIYNLQGVRVNGAQKGMFIKNGKKYIVK
jgi:hypothetical protein